MMNEYFYQVNVVDKVVISKCVGCWDADVSIAYSKHIEQLVIPLKSEVWGALYDFSEWELATPETEALSGQFDLWCRDNNRGFVAVVGKSALLEFQLKRVNVPNRFDGVVIKHFDTVPSAIQWFRTLELITSSH